MFPCKKSHARKHGGCQRFIVEGNDWNQLQMLLFPNTLCCSLYEQKMFMKFLPANNFCQLLRVTRKRSCASAGNAQAQLHFRDDQQRAFGISNISNCEVLDRLLLQYIKDFVILLMLPIKSLNI